MSNGPLKSVVGRNETQKHGSDFAHVLKMLETGRRRGKLAGQRGGNGVYDGKDKDMRSFSASNRPMTSVAYAENGGNVNPLK